MVVYKHSADVRTRILNAGLDMWPVTFARAIGRQIGMAHTSVLYHFGTAAALDLAIREHAVKVNRKNVVRQLIARNDSVVADLSLEERREYTL